MATRNIRYLAIFTTCGSILFLGTAPSTTAHAAANGNGTCGPYMYKDNGTCLDARNKTGSSWMRKLDWNFNSSRW
jgi:hypothetical protein